MRGRGMVGGREVGRREGRQIGREGGRKGSPEHLSKILPRRFPELV